MIWMCDITLNNQVISCLSSHVPTKHFAISFIANVQPQTVGVIHYTNVYAHNSSVTNYWERNRDLYFVPCLCSCTFKWLYFLLDPTDPMRTKCIFFVSGEGQRKSAEKSMEMSQMFPSMVNDSRQSNISTGSLLTLGLVWVWRFPRSTLQLWYRCKTWCQKRSPFLV